MASPDPSNGKPPADSKDTDRRESAAQPAADDPAEAEKTIDNVRELDPEATVAYRPSESGTGAAPAEAVVPSVEDCVRELTESGLLDTDEIASFRHRIAAGEGAGDAQAEALARGSWCGPGG